LADHASAFPIPGRNQVKVGTLTASKAAARAA
jgi:hypothetical protein